MLPIYHVINNSLKDKIEKVREESEEKNELNNSIKELNDTMKASNEIQKEFNRNLEGRVQSLEDWRSKHFVKVRDN